MKVTAILTAAIAATSAMTFAALPASANVGKKFENRIDRQFHRIKQGVRSGELTRFEAISLRRQNDRIARKLRKFCRDGHLDRFERKRMNKMLRNANERIYAEKHDDDRRWGRDWRNNRDRYDRYDRYDRVSERFDDEPWYSYRRYTNRWW